MKAILYINQFFGQIGGEEFAGHEPEIREGIVGPGMAFAKALKDEVEITHTVICGDNFMGSKTEEAIERILGFLDDKEFDLFFCRTSISCRTLWCSLWTYLFDSSKEIRGSSNYFDE